MLQIILFATLICGGHFVHGVETDEETYVEETLMNAMKSMGDSAMNTVMSMFQEEKNLSVSRELPELPRIVDCFGLPSTLASMLRSLFKPSPPQVVNTRFYLATRQNPSFNIEVKSGKYFSVNGTGFDPLHRTVIIVHGFMANGSFQWIHDMSNSILKKEDANVFAVDWSGGGGSWKYWKAVANTRVTGHDLTRFAHNLIDAGVSRKNLHLIGHSLGAHICGFVSRLLGGVARITGLDPAQACFRVKDPRMTLDKSDADFVDVIHTNGKKLSQLGLGLPISIGHVDFYPNGGMEQPGCSSGHGKFWNFLPITFDKIFTAICSHGRAYMLFTESMANSRCTFWGHRWDMNFKNIRAAIQAPCNSANCTLMGMESYLHSGRGVFFVHTDSRAPYCVLEPKTSEQMKMSMLDPNNIVPKND